MKTSKDDATHFTSSKKLVTAIPPTEAEVPTTLNKNAVPTEKHLKKTEIATKRKNDIEKKQHNVEMFLINEIKERKKNQHPAEDSYTKVPEFGMTSVATHNNISEFWVRSLCFSEFLSIDNLLQSKFAQSSTKLTIEERTTYLELISSSLKTLLSFRFNVFWSQILYDKEIIRFLDSFLTRCSRFYDVERDTCHSPPIVPSLPPQIEEYTNSIHRSVLLLFYRMSTPKESEEEYLSIPKYREIIEQSRALDISKLVDVAVIYGSSNRGIVSEIVGNSLSNLPFLYNEFVLFHQNLLKILSNVSDEIKALEGSSLIFASAINASTTPDSYLLSARVHKKISLVLDIGMIVDALCKFFDARIHSILWPNMQISSNDESNGEGSSSLLKALENLYFLLLSKTWNILKDGSNFQSPISLLILRCRRILCASLVHFATQKWYMQSVVGNRQELSLEQVNQGFESFIAWISTLLDNSCAVSEDERAVEVLQDDMTHSGMVELLDKWKSEVVFDEQQIEFLQRSILSDRLDWKKHTKSSESVSRVSAPNRINDEETKKIQIIKDVISGYGDGFLLLCLRFYNENANEAIGALVEASLPKQLSALNKEMSLQDAYCSHMINKESVSTPSSNVIDSLNSPRSDTAVGVPMPQKATPEFTNVLTKEERLKILELCDAYNDEFDDSEYFIPPIFNQFEESSTLEEEGTMEVDMDEALSYNDKEVTPWDKSLNNRLDTKPFVQGQSIRKRAVKHLRHKQKSGWLKKLQQGML